MYTTCMLSLGKSLQRANKSEGGMKRLETLIELKLFIRAFRAQSYQFELFELILLLKLDRRLPVERFEATASQSTVPSPPGCAPAPAPLPEFEGRGCPTELGGVP